MNTAWPLHSRQWKQAGLWLAIFLAVAMLVLPPAGAETIARYRSEGIVGYRGGFELMTDPSLPGSGDPLYHQVAFVRASQLRAGTLSGGGAKFMAAGVARGVGVANCGDDFSAGYGAYIDGENNAGYFCYTLSPHIYSVGSTPVFRLAYESNQGACSTTSHRWVVSVDIYDKCLTGFDISASTSKGLEEIVGTQHDFNLETKYLQLNKKYNGTSWQDWGTGSEQLPGDCSQSCFYKTGTVSNQHFNIWYRLKDW